MEGPCLLVVRIKRGGVARKGGSTECVARFSRRSFDGILDVDGIVDNKGGRWRRSRAQGPWLLVFRRKRGESLGKKVERSALLTFRES